MSSLEQLYLEGLLADDESEADEESGCEEGASNDRHQQEGSLPCLMGAKDPRRMMLTQEEHQCALRIKAAIEAKPEVDNLSDFMYAQFALICQDNIEEAVTHVMALQATRQEYDIEDSYEHGCRSVEAYAQLLPEYLLSFGFSHSDGT